jgi:hypothetical protein
MAVAGQLFQFYFLPVVEAIEFEFEFIYIP